jgi:hypothetical protein
MLRSKPDYGHLAEQGKYQMTTRRNSKAFGRFRNAKLHRLGASFPYLAGELAKNFRVFRDTVRTSIEPDDCPNFQGDQKLVQHRAIYAEGRNARAQRGWLHA